MSGLKLGAHMSIAGGVSNALDAAEAVHSNAVQVFMKSNRQWSGPKVSEDDVSRWNDQMPSKGVGYAVSHASLSHLPGLAQRRPVGEERRRVRG